MIVKFRRIKPDSQRTWLAVFTGVDPDHLQLSGQLCLHTGEYQLLVAALLEGAKHTDGHLAVLAEGQQ